MRLALALAAQFLLVWAVAALGVASSSTQIPLGRPTVELSSGGHARFFEATLAGGGGALDANTVVIVRVTACELRSNATGSGVGPAPMPPLPVAEPAVYISTRERRPNATTAEWVLEFARARPPGVYWNAQVAVLSLGASPPLNLFTQRCYLGVFGLGAVTILVEQLQSVVVPGPSARLSLASGDTSDDTLTARWASPANVNQAQYSVALVVRPLPSNASALEMMAGMAAVLDAPGASANGSRLAPRAVYRASQNQVAGTFGPRPAAGLYVANLLLISAVDGTATALAALAFVVEPPIALPPTELALAVLAPLATVLALVASLAALRLCEPGVPRPCFPCLLNRRRQAARATWPQPRVRRPLASSVYRASTRAVFTFIPSDSRNGSFERTAVDDTSGASSDAS